MILPTVQQLFSSDRVCIVDRAIPRHSIYHRRKQFCQEKSEVTRQEIQLILHLPFNDLICLYLDEFIILFRAISIFVQFLFFLFWKIQWSQNCMLYHPQEDGILAIYTGIKLSLQICHVVLCWIPIIATETYAWRIFFFVFVPGKYVFVSIIVANV